MNFKGITYVVVTFILIILLALVLAQSCLAKAYDFIVGGAGTKLRLVNLHNTHRRALERITSDEKTMAMVGDGGPWTRTKVSRFLAHNRNEQRQGKERENYYWGISVSQDKADKLVGVVGIHPVNYGRPETEGLYFLTIFLAPEAMGKGYGVMATMRALNRFWAIVDGVDPNITPVYSDVRKDNLPAQLLMRRTGFDFIGETEVRGKIFLRYRKKS